MKRALFLLLALTSTLTALAESGVQYSKPACEAGSSGCFAREEVARLPLNYNVDEKGEKITHNGKIVPRWKGLLPNDIWEISYVRVKAADGSTAADHMERQPRRRTRQDEETLRRSRGFVSRPYHPNRAVPSVNVVRSERGTR